MTRVSFVDRGTWTTVLAHESTHSFTSRISVANTFIRRSDAEHVSSLDTEERTKLERYLNGEG